jgi:myo-inositol-1(or 4)-monophosphatase
VDLDLAVARAVAIAAAEAAGDLLRNRVFSNPTVHEKGSLGDVVTDLDFASEELILGTIRAAFPNHRIISEELADTDSDPWCNDDQWTWLVDPLDGTNNVAIGLPVLTVGITLCHFEIPVVSVVHDPISRRTWSAIRKQGAWDNAGLLVSPPAPMAARKPLVAWIQGYSVDRNDWRAGAIKLVLAHAAHRVLELWAPLTCWMMLVRGDIDGIIGYRVGELDLYGGALVASEVGLAIRDFSGVPFVSRLRGANDDLCILAGSPRIVTELAGMVSAAGRVDSGLERLMVPGIAEGRWSA